MRVVIATHQRDLRIALDLFLDGEPGLQVVGTASEAASLRALLRTSRPDLVLLDWDLAGHPPASLLAETKTLSFRPWVIVLGRDSDEKRLALAAGADAFAMKGEPPGLLLTAIRQSRSQRTATMETLTIETKGD